VLAWNSCPSLSSFGIIGVQHQSQLLFFFISSVVKFLVKLWSDFGFSNNGNGLLFDPKKSYPTFLQHGQGTWLQGLRPHAGPKDSSSLGLGPRFKLRLSCLI
jgi:hypothetical protein